MRKHDSSTQYTVLTALLLLAGTSPALGGDIEAPPVIEPITAPFEMPEIAPPVFKDQSFRITDYGAVDDGVTLNTAAFKKAIAACAAAGGGTVVVPDGTWLTGPIHLKSNINLHIQEGAEVYFSTVYSDYLPTVLTRWEGMECYNYSPLIYAIDCENIAITGKGTLIGNGQAWWGWKKTQIQVAAEPLNKLCAEGAPVEVRQFGIENGLRPQFIQPFRCKNVLIEGITIKDGPFWTIHPVYCENIIVRGVSIRTHGPNTDGVNLDSCNGGLVEYCFFRTGDDSICLKSGINEDGWRVGKPCENVVIRRCETIHGNGAVVIGSEMSGGVQNIYAYDMNIISNKRGIRIKSMRGRGGFVKNVYYEDFKIGKLRDDVVIINMKYGMSTVQPKGDRVPVFENIFIKNVHCEEARSGLRMIGLDDQKIRGVTIENTTVGTVAQKNHIRNVENLKIIGGNLK